jgi:hypothetical protein
MSSEINQVFQRCREQSTFSFLCFFFFFKKKKSFITVIFNLFFFLFLERPALITFVTAGYPEAEETVDILLGLESGGADIIELGN